MSEEVKEEGTFKVKKKPGRPRKLVSQDETLKVNLDKKEEDAVEEQETNEVLVRDGSEASEEVHKENVEEKVEEPTGESKKEEEEVITINEITDEEVVEQPIIEEPKAELQQRQLPENIEKLLQFMEETGGTVEDYVRINADYSNIDETALLREYYKRTKPHLNADEISFIMEDNFSYDEEVDEERDIRKKKLAYKEEVAKARGFLNDMKDKYYAEIKNRPNITNDQKKAMDFFNRYNEDLAHADKVRQSFHNRTDQFFNDDFKGFEFNVGEKRFNYKVNDINSAVKKQSNIDNFLSDFVEDGEIKNMSKYHKALFAARNADTIANHFYEQGKADATRDIMSKSNNINEEPRKVSNGEVFVNGWKVKAISGIDSSKLKIKKR